MRFRLTSPSFWSKRYAFFGIQRQTIKKPQRRSVSLVGFCTTSFCKMFGAVIPRDVAEGQRQVQFSNQKIKPNGVGTLANPFCAVDDASVVLEPFACSFYHRLLRERR